MQYVCLAFFVVLANHDISRTETFAGETLIYYSTIWFVPIIFENAVSNNKMYFSGGNDPHSLSVQLS